MVQAMFDRLSGVGEHGSELVTRCFRYLTAARHGISEDEILRLLGHDEAYYAHFLEHAQHRLPTSCPSRKPYLRRSEPARPTLKP